MDKPLVIATRDRLKAIKTKMYGENGSVIEIHPTIILVFANGADRVFDKNDGSVIWNDSAGTLTAFSFNDNSSTNVYSMSRGGKVDRPVSFCVEEYDNISRIQAVFSKTEMEQYLTAMALPANQKKNLLERYFTWSDIDHNIMYKKAAGIGYSNLHSRKYNKGLSHSDLDEYTETVHPTQL